jgi:hypothetical protein
VRILAEYPEEVISSEYKKILLPELISVLCKEDDELVLLQFLARRVAELKKAGVKSDETPPPKL